MSRLVVVSNRVAGSDGRIGRAGGLAIALNEALQAHGGLWFGWSGEITSRPVHNAAVSQRGNVTYATIDLSPADSQGHLGYANATLWPLLHSQIGVMQYNADDFAAYQRVNERFARTLKPLLKPDDIIWVHDFHLITLATALRAMGVTNRIGFFLHTPLPPENILTFLPHYDVLMRALDQYDLVGLQTPEDLSAFETIRSHLSIVPAHAVAECFPIGIDAPQLSSLAQRVSATRLARRLKDGLSGRQLVISVDRLDSNKGIPHRLEAVNHLLTHHREWHSKFSYLQLTPQPCAEIAESPLFGQITSLTNRINDRFSTLDWTPACHLVKTLSRASLAAFYRNASVGLVTPLRDGMSLVAKEYVAAQDARNPGCLILSSFTGAVQELGAALTVNPMDREAVAQALQQALTMSHAERTERWNSMMATLRANSFTHWRDAFLTRLTDTRLRGSAPITAETSEPIFYREQILRLQETAAHQVADLTERQRQIMELVVAGHPSKIIAADLGISQRTVENHRASIMRKTGTKSLPALTRLAFAANFNANQAQGAW